MNPTRQLLALFRFNLGANPYVVFMPLIFSMPLIIAHVDFGHFTLASQLEVPNLFMVAIVGVWTLAPEMSQGAWSRGIATISGAEFLLTRAVDRAILYRARVLYLYLLLLAVPLILLTNALWHPNLLFTEHSKEMQTQYLQMLPGSAMKTPDQFREPLISFPAGAIWIALWQGWLFSVAALGVQLLLLAIHRLPFRVFLFYGFFMAGVLIPLFLDLAGIRHRVMPPSEQIFLWQVAHPIAFWALALAAFFAVQAVCERWFVRQEQ